MGGGQGLLAWIEKVFGALVVIVVLLLAAIGCIATISIDFLVSLLPKSVEGFISPLAIFAIHGLALLLVFRVNTNTPAISRLAGYLGGYLFMVIANKFIDYAPASLAAFQAGEVVVILANAVVGALCILLVSILTPTPYLSVPIMFLSGGSLLGFSFYLAAPPETGLRAALVLGSFSFLAGVVICIMLLPRRFERLFRENFRQNSPPPASPEPTVLNEPPPEQLERSTSSSSPT
ncbi:MAG: hypothetical protein JXB47_06795 [Anaerolineae bacterium]|nr:hypothetical protein [Anaerolineae bacterium]